MKFTDKKAIHFDLDGTLIDSVPDLALAVNEMLQTLGKERFDEDTIRYWVGNGSQRLVKRALVGKREFDEKEIDETLFQKAHSIFLEAYDKHLCEATKAFPGVIDTLQELKKRGYRLSIITNKPAQFVAPILEGLGFGDLIESYLGGDCLPKKKPDPLPLVTICEQMGVSIKESVMIGDSKNDILAAKAAQMQSVGVTYGYNYGEDIRTFEPDAVVEHFGALADLFEEKVHG